MEESILLISYFWRLKTSLENDYSERTSSAGYFAGEILNLASLQTPYDQLVHLAMCRHQMLVYLEESEIRLHCSGLPIATIQDFIRSCQYEVQMFPI